MLETRHRMPLTLLPVSDYTASDLDDTNRLLGRLGADGSPLPGAESIDSVRRGRIDQAREVAQRYEAGPGTPIEIFESNIRSGGRDLPIRIFMPPHPGATYLHLHGGGWTFGSVWEQDLRLSELAGRAEVAVVTLGYRLAPEHPYPAAVDDAAIAALWAFSNDIAIPTEHLVLGGESAGAHLAVLAALRLRDRHSVIDRVQCLQLGYGIYDLSMTPSQRQAGSMFRGLSTPWLAWFYDQFLPGRDEAERRDPEISPLYAPLHDLPPALLTVGTADPVLDDSVLLAGRWANAGSEAILALYPGAPHGFTRSTTRAADLAKRRIDGFVKSCSRRESLKEALARIA